MVLMGCAFVRSLPIQWGHTRISVSACSFTPANVKPTQRIHIPPQLITHCSSTSPDPFVSEKVQRGVTGVALIAFTGFVTRYIASNALDFSDLQLIKCATLQLSEVNDIFLTVFLLFGPLALSIGAIIAPAASRQKRLPPSLITLGGLFLGFWFFGPYLALRDIATNVTREELKSPFSKVMESRVLHLGSVLFSLYAYAILFGVFTPGPEMFRDAVFYASAVDFSRLFVSDSSVAGSTVDFLLCSTLLWFPLTEDMARRGWFREGNRTDSILTALSVVLVPALGPSLYALLRPRLPESKEKS